MLGRSVPGNGGYLLLPPLLLKEEFLLLNLLGVYRGKRIGELMVVIQEMLPFNRVDVPRVLVHNFLGLGVKCTV
jgi:hypothetical protein